MPLVLTLALRNLVHDRLRLIATVIGIVFSIVLVTVQMGLFLGFSRMVTTMIDNASADLWIMPRGTKCFEDPSLLDLAGRERALATEGVADVTVVVTGFADWQMPSGTRTPVFIVSTDLERPGVRPWSIVAGETAALGERGAIAADRTYFERLGIAALGDRAEIRQQPVRVAAVTEGIRAFTTMPYVFMGLEHVRAFTGMPPDKATFLLVHLRPGADARQVRARLLDGIPNVEILDSAAFADRSRNFWLFGTGAGAALFAGALLGVIVGTVIVAQTLYSSTKEYLNEFATLRAIGSSRGYIYRVIVLQGAINALIGFAIAALVGIAIVHFTAGTALPIVLTGGLMAALFLLTVLMCVGSGIAAILKVMRVDPASAFTR
jgi:putative ABC transport system permease protein